MKKLCFAIGVGIIGAGALANTAQATSLIYDSFNGSSIDPATWTAVTPWANSYVGVSGGDAVFKGIGALVSRSPVSGTSASPIDITGSFAFTGNLNDAFHVVLRADGVVDDQWGNVGGESVIFNTTYMTICSQTANGGVDAYNLAYSTALQGNTYYNFRITDNGNNISVYLNDLAQPIASVTSSYGVGQFIALSDRDEHGGYDSSVNSGSQINLSYISVTTVPEPGAFSLLGLAAASWALRARRKR